jgi:2-oxo-3-hexenedioate decarboxylase
LGIQKMRAADIASLASELLACRSTATLATLPTARFSNFGLHDAYQVLDHISRHRQAQGARVVGRKIGFTNRTIWPIYGVSFPIWAPIWSDTVQFAGGDTAVVDLAPFTQPRIEPEVVFKLARALPPNGNDIDVLRSIEWFAPGFEIVHCHYANWQFSAPDCIADFGLHGALLVGTPIPIDRARLDHYLGVLGRFEATLYRGSAPVDHGGGALVLGSPVRALSYLASELAAAGRPPLAAGEIVSTGTLTNAWPLLAGERWWADYGVLGTKELYIQSTVN